MTSIVQNLWRYPVKGLSPEPLGAIVLQAGHGVSGDRAFALALPATQFDEAQPKALPKTQFLMLARQEGLARLSTSYDADHGILTVKDGDTLLAHDVRTGDGRAAINTFFAQFLPQDQRSDQPRLVAAPGHCFTDVSVHSPQLMHAVSMLNLASVRDLEAKIGKPLDPRRFRANILVDGLAPWVEMDWLERELSIGPVRFRGARLTRRCPATQVNPDTAVRDIDVPKELLDHYGHVHLGLYLHVLSDGTVNVGDAFVPPA